MMPRIQGKVGQVDEPGHQDHGRWVWAVYVSIMAPGHKTPEPITIESYYLQDEGRRHYATEAEAKRALEVAVEDVNKIVLQAIGGKGDEGFYDLKAGKHRYSMKPHQ